MNSKTFLALKINKKGRELKNIPIRVNEVNDLVFTFLVGIHFDSKCISQQGKIPGIPEKKKLVDF